MIGTILSILGSLKGAILGALGLFAGLWALWAKNKMRRQEDTIERQGSAIRVHEAKEEVHKKDVVEDAKTEQQINEVRDKVEKAPDQEAAAGEISGALDGYFGERK